MLEDPEDNLETENSDEPIGDDLIAVIPKTPLSKFHIFGFGGIVAALVVWSVIHLHHGPTIAGAAAIPPSAQANQTISQFLSGGGNSIHAIETSLQTTQKEVWAFENYPSVQQVPLKNLKTNPFAYRGDDKSGAEALRKQAEQQAEMEKTAASLKLQSVMYSSRPNGRSACMINNALCGPGGQIAGFSIEKINPNSVIVAQGTFRFELKLQK